MRYASLVSLSMAIFGPAILAQHPSRSWPTFGGGPSRNMVNLAERNLPADWSVEAGKQKNIKWTAELGPKTFSTPVVADGLVLIGTNKPVTKNGVRTDRATLLAFREADGKLLWENSHPVKDEGAGVHGLLSTPTVSHKHAYYVTPGGEVICAEVGDGKIAWQYDLRTELKVAPLYANICSPLVVGDHVFVATANGRSEDGELPAPEAPSFVALHRKTGKLAWQSNLPGTNIIEGQWSNPTYAEIKGVPQVIFAGGDCVLYSFAPATGDLLWKCACLPVRQKPGGDMDNYFVSTPVVVADRLYVGLGMRPESGQANPFSYFLCLDIAKKGDVSLKSYDAKAAANKGSALVWAFGGPIEPAPKKGRRVYFGRTMSTAAVHDGLVYITEENGFLHCLDALTGNRLWHHDFKENIWGSPYWVDGRILVCTTGSDVVIFAHGRTAKVLATIDMEAPMEATPVAANGTLFIATQRKLYAIGGR